MERHDTWKQIVLPRCVPFSLFNLFAIDSPLASSEMFLQRHLPQDACFIREFQRHQVKTEICNHSSA